MYIRRTLTRTLPNGTQYFSHRLVRTERVGGRVRQVTLLNLGSDFGVGATHWETLCTRVEDLLAGREVLAASTDAPSEVEVEAQRVAALLLARYSGPVAQDPVGTLESVDMSTQRVAVARSVGVERMALWAIGQLGLLDQLQALGVAHRLCAVVLGMIVGRMAAPEWTPATRPWWGVRSALGELLGVDFQTLGPAVFKRAAEALLKHRTALEAQICVRLQAICGHLDSEPIVDLRNVFLPADAGKPIRSESQGLTCPVRHPLALGLVVDRRGFVHRSLSSKAGLSAVGQLQRMLDGLGAGHGALVAIGQDAATHARMDWLRTKGYRPFGGDGTGRDSDPSAGTSQVLADLDRVFASLRVESGPAPSEGIDAAEMFVSVLAYQCVQCIRRRLLECGFGATDWPDLRHRFVGHCLVTVSVRDGDGRVHHVRQATQADHEQAAVYHALGLDPAPGGIQHTIV